MYATGGLSDAGLIGELAEEPHRFGFFQALKLLELHFARRWEPSSRAIHERVRFRNNLSLGFPASEIGALALRDKEGHAPDKLDELDSVEVTPAFFGLLGAQGALPLHYTEKISERENFTRDRAARAFLDIFTNRATQHFYEAWKKYRLDVRYETGGRNHFLPLLLAFAGHASPSSQEGSDIDGIFEESIAHFSATFGRRTVSAESLRKLLTAYFRTAISVEPFVGRWYAVPVEQRTVLGDGNAILGATAMVGERVWQRDLCMRLRIGPLEREKYLAFLPGGRSAKALERILELLLGHALEFEIVVSLRKEDVMPIRLGSSTNGRLGLDSFLVTEQSNCDRDDSRFDLLTIQ